MTIRTHRNLECHPYVRERLQLKKMLAAARGLRATPARDAVILQLQTRILYLKLELNTIKPWTEIDSHCALAGKIE